MAIIHTFLCVLRLPLQTPKYPSKHSFDLRSLFQGFAITKQQDAMALINAVARGN
jgi:hypothetical protein